MASFVDHGDPWHIVQRTRMHTVKVSRVGEGGEMLGLGVNRLVILLSIAASLANPHWLRTQEGINQAPSIQLDYDSPRIVIVSEEENIYDESITGTVRVFRQLVKLFNTCCGLALPTFVATSMYGSRPHTTKHPGILANLLSIFGCLRSKYQGDIQNQYQRVMPWSYLRAVKSVVNVGPEDRQMCISCKMLHSQWIADADLPIMDSSICQTRFAAA
ncbi:hypothetical protein DFH06DRAFT_1145708 [Mycena polygramma]|nr:hypothetical protein DFH06DRAFT_1145708 [Mycena polygramma]